MWLLFVQKHWGNPKLVIPDRLKELLLQAAEYTYKRSFNIHQNGTDSEMDTAECIICMGKLKAQESSTGGTEESMDPLQDSRIKVSKT